MNALATMTTSVSADAASASRPNRRRARAVDAIDAAATVMHTSARLRTRAPNFFGAAQSLADAPFGSAFRADRSRAHAGAPSADDGEDHDDDKQHAADDGDQASDAHESHPDRLF